MKILTTIALIFIAYVSGCSQEVKKISERVVGGRCEDCEAVLEYGKKTLAWTEMIPVMNKKFSHWQFVNRSLKKS